MPQICKYCNEEAFDVEDQVCKACGIVNEDIQFGIECHVDLSYKPFQQTKYRKSRLDALNHGIEALGFLCHQHNVPSSVKMEALALLNSVYSGQRKAGKSFKCREDVSILAGCCLMNLQEKHKGYVSMNSLCCSLKCSKKKVFKMSKMVKHHLSEHSKISEKCEDNYLDLNGATGEELVVKNTDDIESLNIYVTNLLSHAPENIKEKLIWKTTSLTKLAESCWLLTGRSRVGVITASAYLSYKSMSPCYKLSLEKFCSQYSLDKQKARLRVPELKAMLLKLGSNIPSKTKNYVNEKNVLFHLDYILKNSESLRNDLLIDEFTEDGMNKREYDTFRSCYSKRKPFTSSAPLYDESMNASDVEISDTEISSYIRTDKQVNLIQNLRDLKSLKT